MPHRDACDAVCAFKACQPCHGKERYGAQDVLFESAVLNVSAVGCALSDFIKRSNTWSLMANPNRP